MFAYMVMIILKRLENSPLFQEVLHNSWEEDHTNFRFKFPISSKDIQRDVALELLPFNIAFHFGLNEYNSL